MGGVSMAVLSALLLILAQPPFRFILLPFVALTPLVVSLGGAGSGRSAARLGLSFGIVQWGILLAWVPLVVAPRFPWAYPGFGVQVGLLSGLAALMAWSTHRLHRIAGLPLPLAFSLSWVTMEWFKAHFPLGLSFPWMGLGISLTSRPALLGMAEWTGEAGVAFWLAAVNGLLASAILAVRSGRERERRSFLFGLLALVVALAGGIMGVQRDGSLAMGDGPRVAVVGTDVPRALRGSPTRSTEEGMAQARDLLRSLAAGSAELVVLPEATISVPLDGPGGREYLEALETWARSLEASIVVGSLGKARGGEGAPGALTNSVFLIRPDGSLGGRYDKIHLVPGMEWRGFVPGRLGVELRAAGYTLGPLVCYESIFGSLARRHRISGAQILVNVSSDVWFGEGASGWSSVFLHQHAAHLVMRAVENRVGVVRAGNGGFSLFLDPRGRLLGPPVPPEGGLGQAILPVVDSPTVFARTGDRVGPGSTLVWILLLVVSIRGASLNYLRALSIFSSLNTGLLGPINIGTRRRK